MAVNGNRREWEITTEGLMWPCCFLANHWLESDPVVTNDKTLMAEFEKDPNWNNVFVHGLDTVANHPLYKSYIYYPGWESKDPPQICVNECSVIVDEYTGEERSKAVVTITKEN